MIENVENSPRKGKRFRVILSNGKFYDFGMDGGSTYIDHADKTKRENYRKRHLAHPREGRYIREMIPSPALFAYHLLWGESTDLRKNIRALNKMM